VAVLGARRAAGKPEGGVSDPSVSASSHRPCPVCGASGPHRNLHRQNFHAGVLGDGYEVALCVGCGAGFADGIPSQAELNRYYAKQSKYTYDGSEGRESVYDLRRFGVTVDELSPLLPPDGRILDIGCATGGLLQLFRARGFAHVMGVDPSPGCAAAAARLHGIDVRVATLDELGSWTERFDAVLLLGVLEHLREVAMAVEIAARLLRPRGLLYVSVPDVEGFARVRNAPFQQFSMEHVNFFSARSLDRLMAAQGLAPERTWHEMVEWREDIAEPILNAAYRRGVSPQTPSSDAVTGPALEGYIAASHAADAALKRKIAELAASTEPIIVWGAGALTRRLLATTALAQARIVAFVDANPHLQGAQLAGRPVLAPAAMAGRSETILICSVAFEKEIVRDIRERHRLANPLVSLRLG
jgi:2-polyprenyl-3-methyl-5-hydroxy-6-metoxy-1,4-benzoquinol methylase